MLLFISVSVCFCVLVLTVYVEACVFDCVCTCTRMLVCMFLHVFVCENMCVCVRANACEHVCVCICVFSGVGCVIVCVRACVCILCVCLYVCQSATVCVLVHVCAFECVGLSALMTTVSSNSWLLRRTDWSHTSSIKGFSLCFSLPLLFWGKKKKKLKASKTPLSPQHYRPLTADQPAGR